MKIREDEVPFQPLSIQYIYANNLEAFKAYLLKTKLVDELNSVLTQEKSTTGLNVLLFSVLYDRLDFVNYLFENYEFNLTNTGIQAKTDTYGIELILRKLTYLFQIVEVNDFEEFRKHLHNLNLDKHDTITLSQILSWRHNGQTLYEYALLQDKIDIAICLYCYSPHYLFEVIDSYSQAQIDKLTTNHIQVVSVYKLFKKDKPDCTLDGLLTCPQAVKNVIECSITLGQYQFAYVQIIIDLLQANIFIAGPGDVCLGNMQLNYNQSCLAQPIMDEIQKRKKAELMLLYIDCNLQDPRAGLFKEFNFILMRTQIETLSALGKGMSGIISAHPSLVLTLFEALEKQAEKITYLEKQLQYFQEDVLDGGPKTEFLLNFKALSLNGNKATEDQGVEKERKEKTKRALTK